MFYLIFMYVLLSEVSGSHDGEYEDDLSSGMLLKFL
jgi:hypothetical protein